MSIATGPPTTLLPVEPRLDVAAYRQAGGGVGIERARTMTSEDVIGLIERSGLRGRGGAGFPTAHKWAAVQADPCTTRYVVCNAAEGEPGTFKDRWLIRHDPYAVVEGTAIAALAIGASGAFIAIKAKFERERERLAEAVRELRAEGLLDGIPIEIVAGPDDYLFGEEKAMLEVIEGRPALPRLLPPYQVGLFARPRSANPTVVNNAETLANVARILGDGDERFRATGTDDSPGTMLFTICGDVQRPGVYELPLGTPLSVLIERGGGVASGRRVSAVFAGASAAVIGPDDLETPLSFEGLRAIGSGLGSGGFIVYDDSTCIIEATAIFSRFLAEASCNQCPACKQGTRTITELLVALHRGDGDAGTIASIRGKCERVTGGTRCGLPTGEERLVLSVLDRFGPEAAAHVGVECGLHRDLTIPSLDDLDPATGRFTYHVEPALTTETDA